MNSTLYYRILTEKEYCPDCKGILTLGIWNKKDQVATCVCLECGYNFETLGWLSKKAKKGDKNEKEIG